MTLDDRLKHFIANAYSPANLDTAPEKLRQAVELLREVIK